MFFEGNDVSVSLPTCYGKSLIHQAAPVIDRLPSLDESGHYIYCARCTISMYLGQEDFPPSTFGLFANEAIKLKLAVSFGDSFDREKSRSFFTLVA